MALPESQFSKAGIGFKMNDVRGNKDKIPEQSCLLCFS